MAIAAAQYDPEENKDKFVVDIALGGSQFLRISQVLNQSLDDDDSDNDSHDSEESDTTVDALNFTDISTRPSTVKCKASPKDLLTMSSKTLNDHGGMDLCAPLTKAILDNDVEAFVKICDLHHLFPEPIPTESIERWILTLDRPDMLDEYIRRTGVGIEIALAADDENTDYPDTAPGSADDRKLYFGLLVHGKKRKDLARKNDPDAQEDDDPTLPLLWRALKAGALKTVDYLSGDGPVAAYTFYANSNKGHHAEKIRGLLPKFTSVLPKLLGWTTNSLNESPLTAALVSKNLTVMQKLLEKSPKLAGGWLHDR